jgi:hypothetical protein
MSIDMTMEVEVEVVQFLPGGLKPRIAGSLWKVEKAKKWIPSSASRRNAILSSF